MVHAVFCDLQPWDQSPQPNTRSLSKYFFISKGSLQSRVSLGLCGFGACGFGLGQLGPKLGYMLDTTVRGRPICLRWLSKATATGWSHRPCWLGFAAEVQLPT